MTIPCSLLTFINNLSFGNDVVIGKLKKHMTCFYLVFSHPLHFILLKFDYQHSVPHPFYRHGGFFDLNSGEIQAGVGVDDGWLWEILFSVKESCVLFEIGPVFFFCHL